MRRQPLVFLFAAAAAIELASCQRVRSLPEVKLEGLAAGAKQALSASLETARTQPNDAGASGRLGMLLLAHQLPEPALICFERARALDASAANWRYYTGVLLQEQKSFAAARKAYEEFLALDPASFAGTVRLGETLLALGDRPASLERFLAALDKRPKSPRACYGMGLLLQSQGKHAEAREFFERALATFPRYLNARFALAESSSALGDAAKTSEMLAGYETLRGRADSQPVPFDDPLMAEVRRLDTGPAGTRLEAQRLARAGRVTRAVGLLQNALREDPRQTGYRTDLATYFIHQKNWGKAEEQLRAILEETPDLAAAHWQRGELLVAQGKPDRAVEAFGAAVNLDPSLAEAQYALGECQRKLGLAKAAEPHLVKALELQPDHVNAHVSLGLLLVSRGQYAGAIPHLAKADSAPGEIKAGAMQALGTAYGKTGQAEESRKAFALARVLADAYGVRATGGPAAPLARSLRRARK